MRWITSYPDGDIEEFKTAEDARKAAKLYNKAHGQSLARVFVKD